MRCFMIIIALSVASIAAARVNPYGDGSFMKAFTAIYQDCVSAKKNPEKNKDKECTPTHGVLRQGPIAGHTPQHFLGSSGDERWRGSTIEHPATLKKGRESVDHWMPPGTVLVLDSWRVGKGAIHLRWRSVDKLVPSEHPKRKPEPVGIDLTFRLPKDWTYQTQQGDILQWLASWVEPFDCVSQARSRIVPHPIDVPKTITKTIN